MIHSLRFILIAIVGVILLGQNYLMAQDYEEVTIRELNEYDEPPQTTEDFSDHPMVDEQVEFEAIVVSNPRSSGLANFTEEEDDDEIGIGRIHFFVVDRNALDEGKEGMYMQIVAADVGEFEGLERGDLVTFQGTHEFFNATVQFNPDNQDFQGNILEDDNMEEYRELLEPMEIDLSDLNMNAEEGTYTFNPEAYQNYINAYVQFNEKEVIGSDIDDDGRPNFYWVDDEGIPAWTRDVSLRYRNDRNDEQGGYRDGYNYRRVAEDGAFQPPPSGSIVDVSGFVVWDGFDPYDLNESDELSTLQIAPMEDGYLWWGTDDPERITHDPNNSDYDWPNDLEVVGFPPEISNYQINTTQPGAEGEDDQVEISADIVGPDGDEEIYDVKVTWETSRGDEGEADMDQDGDDSYSYTFDEFEDFTSVEFAIEATADTDRDGETVSITGRFTDGFVDAAGNTLDMTFIQVGETINDIATIQTTTDGNRDISPLEAAGVDTLDVPFDIDAVVVSTADAGFVVVHDEASAWSGVPLAASDDVADLELGQQVNITDATITNEEDNVYLDDLDFTTGDILDDLETALAEYIPTVTPSEATTNNGAAYEGMVIRLENVLASDNQADSPSDFGEWAIAAQDDENGSELRINDFPDFGAVTGDFSTEVPGNLNANIKVGAEFDAVYGFSAYSFGNPKIHLRSLDDLQTDESYTWPVRDGDLFTINTADEDDESAGEEGVVVDVDNEATFEESVSFDGEDVSYRFALNAAGDNDFDDALLVVDDEDEITVEDDTVYVQLSSDDLIDAFDEAGYDTDESGDFIWTVFYTNDGEEYVQHSEQDGAEFVPSYVEVTMGYGEVVSSPDEPDAPQTVELNQNYPNPCNPTTNIEYQIPEQAEVRLTVYDVLGREVAVLVNEEQTAGSHTVEFDGSSLSSGAYIYRLEAGSTTITKQMMLVK